MASKKPSFEESLKRLEQIVQSIEQGKIGLEESIRQYEEGMGLIRHCRSVLNAAEMKIQFLQANGPNGGLVPAEAPEGADDGGGD